MVFGTMRYFCPILPTAAAAAALFLGACSRREPATQVHVYEMGQKVEIGHIIYTVFETRWETQLGQSINARIPQNRYFLVRMTAVNSSAADELIPNVTVEDDNGNSYTELSNGEGVPSWMGFLRQVKPAEAAQGNVLFDVPPKHYKMRVTDENGDAAALIDIPLRFDAEIPGLGLPEQKDQKK